MLVARECGNNGSSESLVAGGSILNRQSMKTRCFSNLLHAYEIGDRMESQAHNTSLHLLIVVNHLECNQGSQ